MANGEGAGKGDSRRPSSVSHAEYAANYDRIFNQEEACSGMKQMTTKTSTTPTILSDTARNCIGSVSPALEHEIKQMQGHCWNGGVLLD